MNIDWVSIALGWLGGIPSGLFANWLYNKYLPKRKKTGVGKGAYFNSTMSEDWLEFEGRVKTEVDMKEVIARVIGDEHRTPPPSGGNT